MNSPDNQDIALVMVEGNVDVDDLYQEPVFLLEVANKIHSHSRMADLYTTIHRMRGQAESMQAEKLVTSKKCKEVERYLVQWLHTNRDTRAIMKRAIELSQKDEKQDQDVMNSHTAKYDLLHNKLEAEKEEIKQIKLWFIDICSSLEYAKEKEHKEQRKQEHKDLANDQA